MQFIQLSVSCNLRVNTSKVSIYDRSSPLRLFDWSRQLLGVLKPFQYFNLSFRSRVHTFEPRMHLECPAARILCSYWQESLRGSHQVCAGCLAKYCKEISTLYKVFFSITYTFSVKYGQWLHWCALISNVHIQINCSDTVKMSYNK